MSRRSATKVKSLADIANSIRKVLDEARYQTRKELRGDGDR
jgi:hypothetical protein